MTDDDRRRSDEALQQGMEAHGLLEHPMFQGFLEDEQRVVWNAFVSLPLEAPYEQYVAVRALAEEVRRLPRYLKAYIEKATLEITKQELEKSERPRPDRDNPDSLP